MFSLRAYAERQFRTYLELFPLERERLEALADQFKEDAANILSRSNMRGHITTSALIIDPETKKILIIHHRQFNCWLPPGGHHEGGDLLSESALREAFEETGIQTAKLHPWHKRHATPLDIDTHPIGARPLKNEGEHWHHDFMYAFAGNSAQQLIAQTSEVLDAKWITTEEFIALPGMRFKRLAEKLALLNMKGIDG